jgi:hypothetical protein
MVKFSKRNSTEGVHKTDVCAHISSETREKEGFSRPAQLTLLLKAAAVRGLTVARMALAPGLQPWQQAARMMHISRRSLVATAITGSIAWRGAYASCPAADAACRYSIAGYGELMALCSDLRCPRTISKSCLLALPPAEGTSSSLARAILADVRPAEGNRPPPSMFAQAIREQSRTNFRNGRVVTVDGWILSLTETRLYALAGLLPEARAPAA